jgi:predicted acyl esterase
MGSKQNEGVIGNKLTGFTTTRDVPVPMRDGLKLAANLYRPNAEGKYPAIMAFTGFGKDVYWDERFFGFGKGYEPWSPTLVKNSITFEANDPAFWCNYGYILMIVDPRGFNRSPGTRPLAEIDGPPGEEAIMHEGRWARDMYDAIEWAAVQPWCNGAVALSGVSILGFSQWRVAAMNPPHLKAFDPWEAMINFHQDCQFPGGIPETKFTRPGGLITNVFEPAWEAPENEDPPKPEPMHEDDFLAQIKVPALICCNWMDAGCHSRGSLKGYRKISSRYKWLYTHGRSKWAVFYSSEARVLRKMFFDHFLKGNDDRILSLPRVQLAIMEDMDTYTTRWEKDYPIPGLQPTKYFLDPDGSLSARPLKKVGEVTYDPEKDFARFIINFKKDTELIGPSALKLWVSTSDSDDMDLFVTLRKFNREGKEVRFDSVVTPENYTVTIGWMRVSLRELDAVSTPLEPLQKDVIGKGKRLKSGEIVPVEIPVWPAGVLFRKGEKLQIEVAGKYRSGEKLPWQEYYYDELRNKGTHTIHCGSRYDSYFLANLNGK